MSDLTGILNRIDKRLECATDRLLPLVYEELRILAAQRLAQEDPSHTLQATALVHEAYLRLVAPSGHRHWNGRAHFFGAAAEAMRRILVENARRKKRLKHGGRSKRVAVGLDMAGAGEPDVDFLDLDQALTELSREAPVVVEVVQLRYFAGLSIKETAASLGTSTATANRHWAYAKAWLYHNLDC